MDKRKKQKITRKSVQTLFSLITNANLAGFITGQIYSGPLKKFCVPGMNCYSCPGALGACPLGALQSSLSARRIRFPFYVLGYLALIGILVGRFICGWLCVFGLVQELLYKIPLNKIHIPPKADRVLRKLKYGFLLLFVVLFPIILRDELGISYPYFCKWVCPVGMLEGGIPLLLLNEVMRPAAQFLYAWKYILLIVFFLSSIFIHRPFCKYVCPLGAFYGLFHRISFLQLAFSKHSCVDCGACKKVCKMQVDPMKNPQSAECIRCGECVSACPTKSLAFRFSLGAAAGRSSEVIQNKDTSSVKSIS